MLTWIYLIFWVVIVGVALTLRLTKKNRNLQAAQNGEDAAELRKAAQPLLAAYQTDTVLYAHKEEQESYGRTVRTTYFRYAVTWQGQTLCVAPLSVDKKTHGMNIGQPVAFTPENLGKVTVTTKEKNGQISRVNIWLGDKQGQALLQFTVDAQNLHTGRWFPVNILQQEECEAFARFMADLAERVASANPGVEDMIKANDNAGFGMLGAGIAIVGAVLGFFFPPLGIVLSLVGLCMAVISKVKGAQSSKPLLISGICLLISAAFLYLFITVY